MRGDILSKNLVQFGVRNISVGLAGLLRHLYPAKGHKGTFQRLVCLKTHHLFKILVVADISCSIGCQAGHNLGFHVKDAALCSLLLLKLLHHTPELLGSLCGACKEALVSVIGAVVLLNEISGVYLQLPYSAFKAFPGDIKYFFIH